MANTETTDSSEPKNKKMRKERVVSEKYKAFEEFLNTIPKVPKYNKPRCRGAVKPTISLILTPMELTVLPKIMPDLSHYMQFYNRQPKYSSKGQVYNFLKGSEFAPSRRPLCGLEKYPAKRRGDFYRIDPDIKLTDMTKELRLQKKQPTTTRSAEQQELFDFCTNFFKENEACIETIFVQGPGGVGKTKILLEVVEELHKEKVETQILSLQNVLLEQIRTDLGKFIDQKTGLLESITDEETFVPIKNGEDKWGTLTCCRRIMSSLECNFYEFAKLFNAAYPLGAIPPFFENLEKDQSLDLNCKLLVIVDEFEMVQMGTLQFLDCAIRRMPCRILLVYVGHIMQIDPIDALYANEGMCFYKYTMEKYGAKNFEFKKRFRSTDLLDSLLTEIETKFAEIAEKPTEYLGVLYTGLSLFQSYKSLYGCSLPVLQRKPEIDLTFSFGFLEQENTWKAKEFTEDMKNFLTWDFLRTKLPIVISYTNAFGHRINSDLALKYMAAFYIKIAQLNKFKDFEELATYVEERTGENGFIFNGWQAPTFDFSLRIVKKGREPDGYFYITFGGTYEFRYMNFLLPGFPYAFKGNSTLRVFKNQILYLLDFDKTSPDIEKHRVRLLNIETMEVFEFGRVIYTDNTLKEEVYGFPIALHFGCTAQSCVGRNFGPIRDFYINCDKMTFNEFYVAISRATRFDQIKGIACHRFVDK